MAVNPSALGPKPQIEVAAGTPAVGGRLFFYVAGSVGTKQNTYTDSTGGVPNTNPVVLDSLGFPTTTEIWWTAGLSYKVVYAPPGSDDPPNSPIWTIDNLFGMNDTTSSQTEWLSGPTPTFVSATSFTLVGDQTGTFTVGRRTRTTNSGGTIYSTIITSVFGAVTTVTVVNDSGVMDSGLSAVSYGLLQATNKSIPPFDSVVWLTSAAGTNTITASASKTAAGYSTGQAFRFIPAGTNTGATTLNVNGLGAKNIFAGNSALVGGELHASIPVVVVYDGTQFQLQGPVFKQPTRTVLLSGTAATYTTPIGATRIDVQIQGGGAGGSGAQTGAGVGAQGTDSTFAGVGTGGGAPANPLFYSPGPGGTAASGDINLTGGRGQAGIYAVAATHGAPGGVGGSSPFGGAGSSVFGAGGFSAVPNTGSGGGGGGINSTVTDLSGAGGAAGGYSRKLVKSPAVTYAYTVGTGGAAGVTGGAAGNAGGAGASGIIIVDEYYD